MVYPRTNKQNQKKKRKVEPATSQVSSVRTKHLVLDMKLEDLFMISVLNAVGKSREGAKSVKEDCLFLRSLVQPR